MERYESEVSDPSQSPAAILVDVIGGELVVDECDFDLRKRERRKNMMEEF